MPSRYFIFGTFIIYCHCFDNVNFPNFLRIRNWVLDIVSTASCFIFGASKPWNHWKKCSNWRWVETRGRNWGLKAEIPYSACLDRNYSISIAPAIAKPYKKVLAGSLSESGVARKMSRSSYPLSSTCFIVWGQKCETTGGNETSGESYAGIFTNFRFKILKHNCEMMK